SHVKCQFAFGRFGAYKDFTFGRTIALSKQFKVMDQGLHAAGNLPLGWGRNFGIVDPERTGRQSIYSLANYFQAFFHLQHTHKVAIIDIAVCADRDIEIEPVIAGVWEGFTDVPDNAAAAQDGTRSAIGESILFAEASNAPGAF